MALKTKRDAILKEASVLFGKKGYYETSVAELAQASEVAEGTIFYHFKTKSDLFTAILEKIKTGIRDEFRKNIDDHHYNNGLAMMEKIVSFLFDLAIRHEDWFRILQRNSPYEFAQADERCREHLKSIYDTLLHMFEEAIDQGVKDGSIHTRATRKTAMILFSMVNGLIWMRFHGLFNGSSLRNELNRCCRSILQAGDTGKGKGRKTDVDENFSIS